MQPDPPKNSRYVEDTTDDVPAPPRVLPAQTRNAIPMPGPDRPAPMPPPRPPARPGIRIALFGPAGGGKTTFLQGLLTGQPNRDRFGDWTATRVTGDADAGPPLDSDLREAAMNGQFPSATTDRATETWRILGRYPEPSPARRGFFRPAPAGRREASFDLTIVDRPGRDALRPTPEMLRELDQATGLVLLVDPTLMMQPSAPADGKEVPSTVAYLFRMLPDLASYLVSDGRDPRLTQHLAVCVSKLDDPAVYERAKSLGVVDRDPTGPPYVPSGDAARRLFEDLCDRSVGVGDHQIPGLLARFDERRVSYHVVSAVGFYVEPGRDFDESNFINVMRRNGKPYIKRQMPLNVWEIVIGLYEAMAREAVR